MRSAGHVLALSLALCGCQISPANPPAVSDIAGRSQEQRAALPVSKAADNAAPSSAARAGGGDLSRPVATISGTAITLQQVLEPLVRTHGVAVLEDLIVIEMASRQAAERGITLGQADIDREREVTLDRMANPPGAMPVDRLDEARAERLLQAVMAERNISPEQFRISLRRNALLRKLVEFDQQFSEEQYQDELQRAFGERVRVRHIQVATLAEAIRVRERLAAGEDFSELARRFSADTSTAASGGLLPAFSEDDDDFPPAVREAAFKLAPGEVSAAIRVGSWHHLLKLEERIPAAIPPLDEVRPELERRLRIRLTEPAMQDLAAKLFQSAELQISDPALREGFYARHPGR